jgi:hypothetical protein
LSTSVGSPWEVACDAIDREVRLARSADALVLEAFNERR